MEAARSLPDEPTYSYHIKRAVEALEQSGGDWEAAAKLLRQRLETDRELYDALVEPLIEEAIWQTIRSATTLTRHNLWNRDPQPDDPSGLTQLARSNLRTLYNYALPGGRGKVLGDATYRDVDKCIGHHAVYEATNRQRRRWFEMIRDKLPEDDKVTVRKVLKDKQLRRMLNSVKED